MFYVEGEVMYAYVYIDVFSNYVNITQLFLSYETKCKIGCRQESKQVYLIYPVENRRHIGGIYTPTKRIYDESMSI